MTQEEKQLLLIDLCARLPHKVKVCLYKKETCILMGIDGCEVYLDVDSDPFNIESIKPYLRPMSSMTEEEKEEYCKLCYNYHNIYFESVSSIDWLNKKMFAYRTIDGKDMFELGLAIEVTKENNPYK